MSKSLLGYFLYLQEDEDEDSEEESDDDDTAALLAELEKIKKERAEEQERKVKKRFKASWFHCLPAKQGNEKFCGDISGLNLGTGAKGRGGEDSNGEYLEWQPIN